MDELNISSKFATYLISRILSTVLGKSLGCKVDICITNVNASIPEDGVVKIHADIGAEMPKEELLKLVKKNGLI